MKTFPLKIYALDKIFFDGDCQSLVIPALDGEMGVLANCQPSVVAIKAGELRYTEPDGKKTYAAVGDGLMEIARNKVSVLVDFAERAEDIDEIRAREAKERAEELLRSKRDVRTLAHAEAALARAMARIQTKARHGTGQ